MPTYFEQREKIIQAYFRDEILPFNKSFCFCGTLCDNKTLWAKDSMAGEHNDYGDYKGVEYAKMEWALISPLLNIPHSHPQYEDRLFDSMCAALEVLKEIHRSRGEDVDTEPAIPFTKRNLQKA